MNSTKIAYSSGKVKIISDGHAGINQETGQNDICPSLSFLLETYMEMLRQMDDRGKLIMFSAHVEEGTGKIDIYAEVVPRYETEMRAVTDMLSAGLQMLSDYYPDNVKLSDFGVGGF